MIRLLSFTVTALLIAALLPGAEPAPTFAKDVAPILYKSCVSCHRPGQIAPMNLVSYNEVRPWSAAIERAVVSRDMPPWRAHAAGSLEFETDSRGFSLMKAGHIGGDLGGYYESAPFEYEGQTIRLKTTTILYSPLHFKVKARISVDGGKYVNFGNPWWRKEVPGVTDESK